MDTDVEGFRSVECFVRNFGQLKRPLERMFKQVQAVTYEGFREPNVGISCVGEKCFTRRAAFCLRGGDHAKGNFGFRCELLDGKNLLSSG